MASTGTLDAKLKMAQSSNKRPEPPSDYAKRFQESTYFTFYQYVEARPYHLWRVTDLRMLAQVALLEDIILSANDELVMNGITTIGSQGQSVSNPAMAALIKAQQQQGSILRRLGISIDGLVKPTQTKNMAKEQDSFGAAEMDSVRRKSKGKDLLA